MEDIVGLIFNYLHLLKEDGVHEWIFNEVTERFMVYILCKLFEEFWILYPSASLRDRKLDNR